MFRGKPQHSGVYEAPGVPKYSGVKWQFHTRGQVLSSPAIAGGSLYFGSSDHCLYALDLATGAQKWKFKTEGRVTSSPAVSAGMVYFGSYDGNFYAVVGIQSSAAVADGVVYFGCRDSKLYAVDAATGKERWSHSNKGSWVISSPAVRNGTVYFGTSDTGRLYALDAKSGAPVFSLDFKHWRFFSSPAIAGDTPYIGSHQGRLNAVDLKVQKVAWIFETEDSKKNGPTFTKPDGVPNYEAAFFDFFYDDMVTGVQKMLSVEAILSSPVVAGNTVYVGSTDGNVYALM
jgi:outer membrane protein assembly factor BamB